ncbi:MAG: TonB-dependent receptor [Alphaproteobacteria bacterium]|nr:MAG: TonB-dependent receptor [Alphaproteobacteria bacterium]
MKSSIYGLATALSFTLGAGTAHAQEQSVRFDIGAQPVSAALQQFAEQSGLQLAYITHITNNLETRGLSGSYAPSEALERILAGTGLEYRRIDDKTIAILTTGVAGTAARPGRNGSAHLTAAKAATSVALAQAAGPRNEQTKADGGSADGEIEHIVVTGSRIRRTNATTPTPVNILDARELALNADPRLADTLNELPAIGATQTPANTNANPQEAGTNFLNLRRLGIDRTLVLVNGRRHVGSRPGTAAVDINTIPAAMVERVEVITGGASAVYGADAVSGVVNLILKDDFEGLQFDGQVGISDEGDGENYTFSATGGVNFGDGRGNVYFNATWDKAEEISATDRRYASENIRFAPNPDNTGPNDGIPDQILFDNTGFIGTPAGGRVNGPNGELFEAQGGPFTFDSNGNLVSQALGNLPAAFLSQGGDFVDLSRFDLLQVPIERLIFSGGMKYELAEKIDFFLEAKFAQTQSATAGQPTFSLPTFSPIEIQADNPFVPQALRDILAAEGVDSFFVSRTNVDQGQRRSKSDRDTIQLAVGFDGDLAANFGYSVHYQYGRSDNTTEFINEQITPRFNQQLDAVRDPATGEIVCRDPSGGCVPLNVLGPNAATPEALAFSHTDFVTEGVLEQNIINATLVGDTADFAVLPAGAIGFAAGFEYRKERAQTEEGFLRNSGQIFPGGPIEDIAGSFDVWEVFGEVSIPLLRGLPFAHEANVEGAVRFADYSTIGSATTWKIGGDWSPIEDVRFRAVGSRAVRAPNIGELFSPTRLANIFIEDPCDVDNLNAGSPNRAANCAALGLPPDFQSIAGAVTTRVLTGGNPDLKEETADTLTAGVVLTPRFVRGLSVSIDYWDIDIKNAVNSFPVQAVANNCVDLATTDNPFCDSIIRRADGNFESISSQLINVASFKARGIDFQAGYFFDLDALSNGGVPGGLGLSLVGTYLDRLDFFAQEQQAVPDREAGELGDPEWTVNFRATYEWRRLTVSLYERFISSQKLDLGESPEFREPNSTGSEWYSNVHLRYAVANEADVYVGVDNLFDNAPPPLARVPETRSFGTDAVVFDQIGRFVYGGLTVKF